MTGDTEQGGSSVNLFYSFSARREPGIDCAEKNPMARILLTRHQSRRAPP
jgi:hypothetical protein